MYNKIDCLVQNLNLSSYQANKLKTDYDKYNISRLEKRGGVLYAPYVVHGFLERVYNLFLGRRADLIGQNRILLRAQRNIKFCANGYHCVKVGRYTYYVNAIGDVVSRSEFMRQTRN
jgi:hypothetical protein